MVPEGSAVVVMLNGGQPMVMENCTGPASFATGVQLSFALTEKEKVPDTVGVPDKRPDEFMFKPVGNAPEVMLKFRGDKPPEVCN
jgi:hypothetical protein